MEDKTYVAIDLKSFYASVECVERGLDPMSTNLVVADPERTEKTICLAVSPPLKAYGLSGRSRLFEVVQTVKGINAERLKRVPGGAFAGSSCDSGELEASPDLALDYIVARPQMAHYIYWSTKIYEVYLKYVAPEDIHVYSIDEVFMDITHYMSTQRLTSQAFTRQIILDVLKTTGITAAAGIGTNLYLAKVAMDIGAKHVEPDENGVRIAYLDEMLYRRSLWEHRPLRDFWRVGRGYAKKLEAHGLFTMGDIARCSIGGDNELYNEALLYKLFGVNAELLIDHAWGWEPCTISDIKAYKPETNSLSSGQVLQSPYAFQSARLVACEMADALALELVDKGLVTDQLVLTVQYDAQSLKEPERRKNYSGDVTTDYYGRAVPKHSQGTANLKQPTASTKLIMNALSELFDRIVDKNLLVRKINIGANRVTDEMAAQREQEYEQLDLFGENEESEAEQANLEREKSRQNAILSVKKKFGKNAILKGIDLEKDATAKQRNDQIGGHRA